MTEDSYENKAVSGAKWSFLTKIAAKAVTPITFIILALILSPEDFGIVAITTVFVKLADIFWNAGMSQTIVQKESDDIRTSANFAFFANIILAVIVYTVLFFTADLVAVFYKDPRLTVVLQIQAIKILIKSLSGVQFALLRRNLQFRTIFHIKIFTTTLPSIVISIPLALLGFGYWALVLGQLFGSFLELVLVWFKSNWRPSFEFNPQEHKELIRFGSWLTLEFLLSWLTRSVDIFIISYYLDLSTVGLYQIAKKLLTNLFEIIFKSTKPVWFSLFSRIQSDFVKVTRVFLKLNKFFTMMALPMGIGLFLTSDLIVATLFNDEWIGMGIILGLLGLSRGFYNSFFAVNPSVYRALNHPEIQPKLLLIKLFIRIPMYIITVSISLELFLYSIVIERLVMNFLLHSYYTHKVLKINPFRRLIDLKYIGLSSVIMILCVMFTRMVTDSLNDYLNLPIVLTIGVASYFLTLYPFEKTFMKQIKELLLNNKRRPPKKRTKQQILEETTDYE